MKIIAVVVTFNRLRLLQRTIAALKEQTHPLSALIVVNNGSTDGTAEWLDGQTGLTVISQANTGGSGGFYTGMMHATDLRADWTWCMDDDVFPAPDCLERLLEAAAADPDAAILAPRRRMAGAIVCNDFTGYDLRNPFASLYKGSLRHRPVEVPTRVAGTAFEGPLIRSDVVAAIGLPRRELFIFCDDTDYCLRAHLAGFALLYVPDAKMEKAPLLGRATWSERQMKKKWKRYYQVRNATFLNHHYGRTWGVRYVRGFMGVAGYIVIAALTAPFSKGWRWTDIPHLWRAYRDGLAERLGKM